MKLDHLNLTVTDVQAARDFLVRYFGLKAGGGNQKIAALTDDDGLVLTLMSMELAGETEVRYPASFHIGFGQETEVMVNDIYHRLRQDGFDVEAPSRLHGSWTFYVQAPGGFVIEVGA